MVSDKRNFDDFKAFPGEIIDNIYTFPPLFLKDVKGNIKKWAIFARLVKSQKEHKHNWNIESDIMLPLNPQYIYGDKAIPPNTYAQVWTENSIEGGKLSRSVPSYSEAKNVGKKNERNIIQQALVDARSKYLKKIKEGSRTWSDFTKKKPSEKNAMYYPMLAHTWKGKNTFPIYVQPKLDGDRCVSYLFTDQKTNFDNTTIDDVILYSRGHNEMSRKSKTLNKIRTHLLPILQEMYDDETETSIYLDGELYVHGMPLEYNTGAATSDIDDRYIEYHIFDCFYPTPENEEDTFEQRYVFLQDIAKKIKELYDDAPIKVVETILANNMKEEDKWYKYFLDKEYEGIILREPSGVYKKDPTRKSDALLRSKSLLKRKPLFSDEFEIVGYERGKRGRELTQVKWVCLAKNGKTFSVTPNWNTERREKILKECDSDNGQGFEKLYKGRMMTVEYRGLSKYDVPTQAKAIEFRDYQ